MGIISSVVKYFAGDIVKYVAMGVGAFIILIIFQFGWFTKAIYQIGGAIGLIALGIVVVKTISDGNKKQAGATLLTFFIMLLVLYIVIFFTPLKERVFQAFVGG